MQPPQFLTWSMTNQYSDPPFPNAAIDIGTNTIKLLIGDISSGKLVRLLKKRVVTRLGKDLDKHGILNKENFLKSIGTLKQFKVLIEEYKCGISLAVGTSALRDAGNSREFIDAVKDETGINLTIISGDTEAELTAKGILGYHDSPPIPAFLTDIGGGSTEWTIYGGSFDGKRSSLQAGAVRLYERFLATDPPDREEIRSMRSHIKELLEQSFLAAGINAGHFTAEMRSFVATGGTAVTLAVLDMGLNSYDGDKIHLHTVSYNRLNELYEQLSAMPVADRANIKGLEAERADIIIPGIVILLVLMETLGADILITSDYGLLEGLLNRNHSDLRSSTSTSRGASGNAF